VPTEFAHHRATVIASVDTLRIVAGDRVTAIHRRCWGREQVFYEPVHYLALLAREPRGAGLRRPTGGLGAAGLLRRPAAAADAEFGGPGTRQFIKVLRLLERADLDAPGAGLLLSQAARRQVVPPAARPAERQRR
jgi:hypothetical protein